MSTEIRVKTDDNELTLEELSWAMPDTSVIMVRVGENWWRLIYSARGGNWPLAEYYLRRVRKLENILAVLRPKHADRLRRFQDEALPTVQDALDRQDLAGLEAAYATATAFANVLHGESGYPYINWVLPDQAPAGLQLSPVEPGALHTPDRQDGHH